MELDEQIAWLEDHLREACEMLSQDAVPEIAERWQRISGQIDKVLSS